MITRPTSHALRLTALVAAALAFSAAHAGADLEAIKARDMLRCGVSDDIPGFSERDASGRWRGMNVDFCRAVAAAVLGSPDKVEFHALKSSTRFPALKSKTVDLLVRNATWTMTREALLKLRFPVILFYDGQGFMVKKSSHLHSLDKFKGATVCVEKGTTHEARLGDYFRARDIDVTPLVIDSAGGAALAFLEGRCQAFTSDSAQLAAARARAPGGGRDLVLLPDRISKEPMGPVVRSGDQEWETLVRWVGYVLIAAEEQGINRANVDERVTQMRARVRDLVSGHNDWVARSLGVHGDWALRAIRAVGNYGEIYERNLGRESPLDIERGQNRLWSQGGLLYAPPLD
jgi:general L-amino acid transport system substrate-binding protein